LKILEILKFFIQTQPKGGRKKKKKKKKNQILPFSGFLQFVALSIKIKKKMIKLRIEEKLSLTPNFGT
jgi:hypothetical protein